MTLRVILIRITAFAPLSYFRRNYEWNLHVNPLKDTQWARYVCVNHTEAIHVASTPYTTKPQSNYAPSKARRDCVLTVLMKPVTSTLGLSHPT